MATLPTINPVIELEKNIRKIAEEGVTIDFGNILGQHLGNMVITVNVNLVNYKGSIIRLKIALFLIWLGSKIAGIDFEEENDQ